MYTGASLPGGDGATSKHAWSQRVGAWFRTCISTAEKYSYWFRSTSLRLHTVAAQPAVATAYAVLAGAVRRAATVTGAPATGDIVVGAVGISRSRRYADNLSYM